MGQSERKQTVTPEDVLNAFDQREDPSEPLTTSEVADALGCSRQTVDEILYALAEQGELATKTMDNQARVWWRTNAAAASVAIVVLKQISSMTSKICKRLGNLSKMAVSRLYDMFKLVALTEFPSRYLKIAGLNKNKTVPNNINPDDQFWEASGMLPSDGPSDVSSNVDRYLYGERGTDE